LEAEILKSMEQKWTAGSERTLLEIMGSDDEGNRSMAMTLLAGHSSDAVDEQVSRLLEDPDLRKRGTAGYLTVQWHKEKAFPLMQKWLLEPAELVRGVRAVAGGDALLAPSVTRRLIEEFVARSKEPRPVPEFAFLTDREREVTALVAEGLSNSEIAERLYVSAATVKTHVSRSMTKLQARDRAQLVVMAYESGLVRPGWLAT